MKNTTLGGKPYAGNPHVRLDEGKVASAKPRRGSLLCKRLTMGLLATLCAVSARALESSYGPFVPGVKVEVDTGLVGYAVKGLPSGLKLNKKTGVISGVAKKPSADGGNVVTFTKKGEEVLSATFIVGPIPRLNVLLSGDTAKCKVTGGNKSYLAGKKVSLNAKAPKGTLFAGWHCHGAPWPDEVGSLNAKQKIVMPPQDIDLTAVFKAESVAIDCGAALSVGLKEPVSIPVVVECESELKAVTAKKLPAGLKYNKKTGFIEGAAKKTGLYPFTLTVTTKAGSKVTKAFELAVLTKKPVPQPVDPKPQPADPEPQPGNEDPVDQGGVQLWDHGPYWAECNVGASTPEEYGYYFWWGDTVGYTHIGSTWAPSIGETLSNFTPFTLDSCPTCYTSDQQLRSAGYVDSSTGNLAAAYDAATAHLGAPWRMPTDADFQELMASCTMTWTTRNGICGQLVTGKGKYASKSIFLPAAGYGAGLALIYDSMSGDYSSGNYWSSTPISGYNDAWHIWFNSNSFRRVRNNRHEGYPVRPVRDFAK